MRKYPKNGEFPQVSEKKTFMSIIFRFNISCKFAIDAI